MIVTASLFELTNELDLPILVCISLPVVFSIKGSQLLAGLTDFSIAALRELLVL
jgi:hypothetical protein